MLVHASFLEIVHIYCMKDSEYSARNAGRILSSCPNLVSFKFVPALRSRQAEDCLAIFEQPWSRDDGSHCVNDQARRQKKVNTAHPRPQMNFLAMLAMFPPREATIWGLGSAIGGRFRFPDGQEYWGNLHKLTDSKLYEKLAEEGWVVDLERYDTYDDVDGQPYNLEKIFHEKAFELVISRPHLCKLILEEAVFVKKGHVE